MTDRFNVLRTTLTGRSPWRALGFTVLLVVEGSCDIATAHENASLSQFDRIVVPHGLDALDITSQGRVVLLECLPSACSFDHQVNGERSTAADQCGTIALLPPGCQRERAGVKIGQGWSICRES